MKTLEQIITTFNNWSQPWTFQEYIITNPELDDEKKSIFNEIWTKAGSDDIWKFSDLILGCKASQNFIRNHYELKEDAIANIVRALSYQWE
ncbi:hypothetical protein [Flavobacterium sp. '19STA2R22 D10 B1']|uniref:hypothetical protein n=1 Tax=Flavobacterium aerium TaxID=3037261 RepID=UPI00278BD9AA|nr:hypothetical protein [Flavobacterium sp. '19STA2R22 D10 B1']